ncbi:hypothetical protein [Hellea balneolensis]|uniref:hypothetical protein n=1 Tax=Hellea balneolensis TaxID=287478 RepID=UPI00041BBB99|nr:hypothetical protein [Hellea balneolensis]
MKLSDILVVTLFLVMGSLIFAMKKMQETEGADSEIPPTMKTAQTEATTVNDVPQLRLKLSNPETAGSYGRLSLDNLVEAPAANIQSQSKDVVIRPRIEESKSASTSPRL